MNFEKGGENRKKHIKIHEQQNKFWRSHQKKLGGWSFKNHIFG